MLLNLICTDYVHVVNHCYTTDIQVYFASIWYLFFSFGMPQDI